MTCSLLSSGVFQLKTSVQSTANLLKSAGLAIQILANTPSSTNPNPTLESQKEAFTKHSSDYFATLSSIEVRLRRQVYALEEAGLIVPGNDRDAKRGRTIGGEDAQRPAGGGSLDSSWLNARANRTVEQGMEREIWARARELVEKWERGQAEQQPAPDDQASLTDQNMDVDEANEA